MIKSRLLVGIAVLAVVAAACSSSGGTAAPASEPAASEPPAASAPAASEPAASAPARRLIQDRLLEPARRRQRLPRGAALHGQGPGARSGQVESGTWIHRNTDAQGQLSDIRDLIAADVDAIVFNPLDPEALNRPREAQAAGIKTCDRARDDRNVNCTKGIAWGSGGCVGGGCGWVVSDCVRGGWGREE